ncbi:hypothetical protein C8R42DRAFT_573612, partial [Lentinula raphanica]
IGGHWKYKYLLDLDGMSYSGRFMAFLASDSVPVKSTLMRCGTGCVTYLYLRGMTQEIYNIYAYFSGIRIEVIEQVYDTTGGGEYSLLLSPDGDTRLHRIALAGKQCKKTIDRKVDMEGKFVTV